MKLLNILLVGIILSILTTSCTSQDLDVPTQQIPTNFAVQSLQEAQVRLMSILYNPVIKNNFQTQQRVISDNLCITNGRALDKDGNILTRANEEDAMVYVFDIDSVGGYAIMGARPELPELIAICNGNSNKNPDQHNEIESLLDSLGNSISVGTGSIGIGPGIDIGEEMYTVRGATTYRALSSFPTIDHAWGCNAPFSIAWYAANMRPIEETGPTWCGNIALAQLMIHPNFRMATDTINYDNFRTIAQIDSLRSDYWNFWHLSQQIQRVSLFFPRFSEINICHYNPLTKQHYT